MRNLEGYADSTAGGAMQKRRKKNTGTIPPLPRKDKVYDMTKPVDPNAEPRQRNWEIFLHYRGYHNPDLGIWVIVTGANEEEAIAAAMCQIITSKQVEVTAVLRK